MQKSPFRPIGDYDDTLPIRRYQKLAYFDVSKKVSRQFQAQNSAAFGGNSVFRTGAPEEIRTPDPQIRRLRGSLFQNNFSAKDLNGRLLNINRLAVGLQSKQSRTKRRSYVALNRPKYSTTPNPHGSTTAETKARIANKLARATLTTSFFSRALRRWNLKG
jgi:hypothetical protein